MTITALRARCILAGASSERIPPWAPPSAWPRKGTMRLPREIVASMQQLALEQRRLEGVRAYWHIGDIAWGLRQHEGREAEWKIRLWVEDGSIAAWSWLKADGR